MAFKKTGDVPVEGVGKTQKEAVKQVKKKKEKEKGNGKGKYS